MSITGFPGQGPVRVGIPIADLTAGLFAPTASSSHCSSVKNRKRGSTSRRPCCKRRSSCWISRAARWLIARRCRKQAGNDHPTSIPTGVFNTSGWPYQYRRLEGLGRSGTGSAEALGAEDHAARSRNIRPAGDRSQNRKALNAEMENHTPQENQRGMDRNSFNKAGVPCGPIYSIDQVYADPQVEASRHRCSL